MFQFKPAPKNSSTPASQANGQSQADGEPQTSKLTDGVEPESLPQKSESLKNQVAGWLGLGQGAPKSQAARPAARPQGGKGTQSVVGPGVSLQGTLTGAGDMRIEGTFDGTINIQGALFVADGAKITAEIRAGAVSVGGSVKGNIIAGKVEILSTGRVWGDLITTAFATEEGAFLRGQVRMEDNLPTPPPTPQPLPTAVMAPQKEREKVRL